MPDKWLPSLGEPIKEHIHRARNTLTQYFSNSGHGRLADYEIILVGYEPTTGAGKGPGFLVKTS